LKAEDRPDTRFYPPGRLNIQTIQFSRDPETLFLKIPWFYNFFENFAPSGYRNLIFAAMKGSKTNQGMLFWYLGPPSRKISFGASSIFKTFNIFKIGL